MEKVFGAIERHDELINIGKRAILQFGYGEDGDFGYDYRYTFSHVPTHNEVMRVIDNHVNKLTDEKILTGYVWNNIPVYLSTENQFNFKAAYDVAMQTQGAILPITFKLGEGAEGTPEYYTFEDMATFSDFYTGAIAFIQQTLAEGWQEKDQARETFKDK